MKKAYTTPTAEKIQFSYSEQLTASAGGNIGTGTGDQDIGIDDVINRAQQIFGSDECEACELIFDYFG